MMTTQNKTPFTSDELCTLGDVMDALRGHDAVKTEEKPLFETRDDGRTYEEEQLTWRENSHVTTESWTETVEEPKTVQTPNVDGTGVTTETVTEETEQTHSREVKVTTDSYVEVTLSDPSAATDIRRICDRVGFDPDAALTLADLDTENREATYEIRPATT